MAKLDKLNSLQMFLLIVLFDLGTAVVVSIGAAAKRDAWLAVLLSVFPGILLFLVYGALYRRFPELPITSYTQKIVGKWLGWPLGLVFLLYFTHMAARDLRDYGELLTASTLDRTPLFFIHSLMIIVMVYILHLGLEVLGRVAELAFFALVITGFLGIAFVFLSGILDFNNLLPLVESGWEPVLITAFPYLFSFPYAEMLPFTVLLPYLNNPQPVNKIGVTAIVFSGIILCFTVAINIAALGADTYTRSNFPLLQTIRLVDVRDFIQRLDPIVIITLVIGNFFKIIIFFAAIVIGSADLFKVKNHRKLIFPVGLVILLASMTLSSSFAEHIEIGQKLLAPLAHVPISSIIPLLLLILLIIRKRFDK